MFPRGCAAAPIRGLWASDCYSWVYAAGIFDASTKKRPRALWIREKSPR